MCSPLLALAFLLSAFAPADPTASPDQRQALDAARRVVATLQLAGQEYRLAFRGGVLANPAEAQEALLFVASARASAHELPGALAGEMEGRLTRIERLLAQGASADSLVAAARDVERRLTVALGVSLAERPAREPSLGAGARIYARRCAQCHGALGAGDGAAGRTLIPRPANLANPALLAAATPLDIYRRVTHGVPATAMPAFEQSLSSDERWDVVAHVLALSDSAARRGRSGGLAIVFGTVRGELGGALDLASRGESEAAGRQVLDAYMAFEAVEGTLGATEPALVARAEERFTALRLAAAGGAEPAALEAKHRALLGSLAEAEDALTRSRSGTGLFVESLLLMLREGFEAILVIGAIMAVLLKAGATEQQKSVRWGIVAALAASLVTAALLEWLFRVTPAQREALEGGVMLVAAAMLFYVSYWLVSKIEVQAWQQFVKGRIERAVESGSGLALAAVAFLAVYREGFETVLFYKALFVTGGGAGAGPIGAGIVLGLFALVAVFIGIERFGLRIPIRPFFAVTSATLAYMAFVFSGKGVKELQEGGYVGTTLLSGGPRSDVLGLYPTVESLVVQGVILAAILAALVWTFAVAPRRQRPVPEATPVRGTPGVPAGRPEPPHPDTAAV
jgi:high-affinity iron transporter